MKIERDKNENTRGMEETQQEKKGRRGEINRTRGHENRMKQYTHKSKGKKI